MTQHSAPQLRQFFLDFFKGHGHTIVKSSPLVPANDPTLMFTNAGMVQFKELFVGAETRAYKRATTCQKCMRVSGKHNDLEEVGRTARHHTFFEMLGNFSFGDYFKEQAITMAWDLITRQLGLNKDKLWVTIFGGTEAVPADEEARLLWQKISGLPASRILAKGAKDNFWAMGDVGPCGPCTEIHYDQGGPTQPTDDDFENGRVVEIWNNVFMQFERHADGRLVPLPAPSVDTGMGLERLAALVQGQSSNYHSDLFTPILQAIEDAAGKPYQRSPSEDDVSMRVIADHARATSFLVADGVQPSNEGRGYVMRRIMRRAIRHGRRLGFEQAFLHRICAVVVDSMGAAYPELHDVKELIAKVTQTEEEGFRRTLDTGLRILGDEMATVKQQGHRQLPGDVVFKLYDTYGFPKDLTEVIATEQALSIDEAGFDAAMEAQKERSRGGDVGSHAVPTIYRQLAQKLKPSEFVGYPHEDTPLGERPGVWRKRPHGAATYLETPCQIVALVQDGVEVQKVTQGAVEIILQPTPFYGESGGQAGDAGVIVQHDGDTLLCEVSETQKPVDTLTVQHSRLHQGVLRVGDTVWAGYDAAVRKETRAHHSATHILHGALRHVLGPHVKQAGSMVDSTHLRFDYAHFAALSWDELHAIETDANLRITGNHPITTEELGFDAAKEKGAIALFGEKYGDIVRVITMGKSVEFCGGTHARNTGDLGLLLMVREEAVQSGVRRIEAQVGQAAQHTLQRFQARLHAAVGILKTGAPLPASLAADPDAAPILQTLLRARQQYDALQIEVAASGAQAVTCDMSALTLTEHPHTAPYTLPQARTLRDTWQGLVQLANARAADAPAIAQRYGKADTQHILATVAALFAANRDNERQASLTKRSNLTAQVGDLLDAVRTIGRVPVLTHRFDGVDAEALRQLADDLRSKLGSGVLCLACENDGKATLLIAVTKDLTARISAGQLIKHLAPLIGGRGGGKPELAQAGGTNPAGLDEAFRTLDGLLGTL